ncbi:hypothetical protein [Actinoallomurus sp. NPDC050550]|uniref:hypothetical protein n=1 Tax=Actinoallomurus sp. NPDC050550 TaxID=3154937 RepID=UPI0033F70957
MPEWIRAWHNRPELKAAAVGRLRAVQASGDFRKGGHAESEGRLHGGLHISLNAQRVAEEKSVSLSVVLAEDSGVDWLDESERRWGIPRVLGALLHQCLEQVPAQEARPFAVAALEAMPVGAYLRPVVAQWILELLGDESNGVRRHTADGSPQRGAVDQVIELYRRKLAGTHPAPSEWTAAARAAGDLAQTSTPDDPAACAVAAVNAAADAHSQDFVAVSVRVRAMRGAARFADKDAFDSYQATFIETEALNYAALYAAEAVRAAADVNFHTVLDPIRQAAERARAAEDAGRSVDPGDAAALARVRDAADAGVTEGVDYYRWRADRLVQAIAMSDTPEPKPTSRFHAEPHEKSRLTHREAFWRRRGWRPDMPEEQRQAIEREWDDTSIRLAEFHGF